MPGHPDRYDVLVAGGGNAGICAAINARAVGASVLVVEAAPKDLRGGNSRHTRNFRCMHETPDDILVETYPESEYWADLAKVTGGETNEQLARIVIRGTGTVREWMRQHGVRFQPSLGGTLQLSRTNAFFLGGGKALVNAYYRAAQRLGIDIEYNAEVRELDIRRDGTFVSATVVQHDEGDSQGRRPDARPRGTKRVGATAIVTAAGGFQADVDWLRSIWGEAADNFIIRGTPYDTGRVLRLLMNAGARTVGDPAQCHAIATDARAPKFDSGIVTRIDSVSLGIVVNRNCVRFYDEGEDFWPKRYAIWGRLIAQQPGQIAYSIVDAQAAGAFMPTMFPPISAGSIRELAGALQLNPDALQATVDQYNAAVRLGTFDHAILDDCVTVGLTPPKSHWARRLERPPFYAYPLRPGITFTYFGVGVNERAQIVMQDGTPSPNMFAAGEIMSGNILGRGYLAGFGMAIGTVIGRLAGAEAARVALSGTGRTNL